jgi:hypothetical protein
MKNFFAKLAGGRRSGSTINGVAYVGNSVSIVDGKVIVDGREQEGTLEQVVNIQVQGNVEELSTVSGDVRVAGDVGSLRTTSGDVHCASVKGSVETVSGDVRAKTVLGSVKTVSGDIGH